MTGPSQERRPDEDLNDDDLNAMVDQLGAMERSRKMRTAVIFVIGMTVTVAVIWWMATNTEALFRPDLDYMEGELQMLEESTDPVCRTIEAQVFELADDFGEYDLRFEEGILSDDEREVEHLRETARAFRSRFEQVSTKMDDAVFNESRAREAGNPPISEQLGEWFGYMDNEFRILDEMADRQLMTLRGEEVEQRGHKWEDPENLRDVVLMTIDENLEEFRVWARRGAHFCGAAPEGVEPWSQ